ncbi:GNAT family N-acetyltransferase [Nocardioides panaciterrulae]|uniref:GNAT superfamily N-acetyltransferase n=1 Tax=Nocardioides panaciterrulae TaxID=661492 RepID=A0A7Y9E489_9ACTN|nr:GNAT family N-acetyltransferase [Nocardioides panaciterrulae]NYD40737.1 GNAT superfamily N-acetyltransferase [Nocardioides panaciterrulae]
MNPRSQLQVVEVDPADDATIAAWHAVYAASARQELGPVAVPWQHEELRVMVQERGRRQALTAYAGLRDGEVVAAGLLTLPLLDNRHRAELDVHVHPALRRTGLGSQLLAHLEGRAREAGRTVMSAEASWPWTAGPQGAGRAGPEFARRHGYHLGISDVQRMLELPVAEDRLAALRDAAAPHHADYEVRAWVGPVPDDLVRGWVELEASIDTEAPVGGLDLEPRAADLAAYREDETLTARQGRTKINAVALTRAAEVVAYSDLATTVHEPERAYQWGTLVRRDHRGHRLGLALKLATLTLLQQGWPAVRQVMTYNAEVNTPMIAVNELMGYRPVARLGELQKRLGD